MNCIGIDLGGTNVKSALFDEHGRLLREERRPTRDGETIDGLPGWAVGVRACLEALEEDGPVSAIGFDAPGIPAMDNRSIAFMPGRFEGLQGFNWTEFLDRGVDVPVINDAQAALLGEVWQGAAAGLQNAILLTLGTGVGGAVVCDGHLLRGATGRAGHLGHLSLDPEGAPGICKVPGTLEDAIGNATVSRRSNGRFDSTYALLEACQQGDAEAARIWLKSIRALGVAIAGLVNVLDPEVVVIGGGISEAGADLFDPLQQVLDEVEWRPAGQQVGIIRAQLGDLAGAYGAAYNALNEAL